MTLRNITVKADYCFKDSPLRLQQLGKVNFVFAPNGSGKTTISSALATQPTDQRSRMQWTVAPTELPIRVFNEQYRSQVLTERVNGIFTMGDASRQVNDQVDEIVARKRNRAKDRDSWEKEIGVEGDEESATGLLADIAREQEIARKTVFKAHQSLNKTAVEEVFKGFRNNRTKFFDEALRRAASDPIAPQEVTWVGLETRVTTLQGDKQPRALLPQITISSVITAEQIAELGKSSATSGNGELAQLIQQLANEDWVNAGRSYVSDANGSCPFCQQDLPHDFEQKLAEYFADGFDKLLNRATEIRETVEAQVSQLNIELDALERSFNEDESDEAEAITQAITSIRTAVDLLSTRLGTKCSHPTRSIEIQDIDDAASHITNLITARNKALKEHNALVANTKQESEAVVEDGWALFLNDPVVKNAIKRFSGIKKKKEQRITQVRDLIAKSKSSDKEDDKEISALRKSVSNTSEVAERINQLLISMGFHRFHIEMDDAVAGGYRIVRADGSLAFESLSEGEKSFLCFAYFWESLFGSDVSGESPGDVIAVIDDPISSLDSDSLFIVAAHIRHAASMVIEGSSNLRQLVILTHNTQFHNEAAYQVDRPKKEDRHYYRLVKDVEGLTTLTDDENVNKIRGTYPLLWDSVVEAARNNEESALVQVGIFNIVRRIVEGYFRTIGRVEDYQRPVEMSPTDERVVSMFHMWASSGSHTIADDIDQTIDVGGTKHFLKIFRRYFDLVGHSAHFDMMLNASGGADLALPGAIFDAEAGQPVI